MRKTWLISGLLVAATGTAQPTTTSRLTSAVAGTVGLRAGTKVKKSAAVLASAGNTAATDAVNDGQAPRRRRTPAPSRRSAVAG